MKIKLTVEITEKELAAALLPNGGKISSIDIDTGRTRASSAAQKKEAASPIKKTTPRRKTAATTTTTKKRATTKTKAT